MIRGGGENLSSALWAIARPLWLYGLRESNSATHRVAIYCRFCLSEAIKQLHTEPGRCVAALINTAPTGAHSDRENDRQQHARRGRGQPVVVESIQGVSS